MIAFSSKEDNLCSKHCNWPGRWVRPRQLCTGSRQTVSSFVRVQSGRRSSDPECSSWEKSSNSVGKLGIGGCWTKLRIGFTEFYCMSNFFRCQKRNESNWARNPYLRFLTFSSLQQGRVFGWNTLCTVWSARPICPSSSSSCSARPPSSSQSACSSQERCSTCLHIIVQMLIFFWPSLNKFSMAPSIEWSSGK